MRRYTLARFTALGTLQSRAVEVAGESATVDATRSFVAAARHGAIEGAGGAIAATRDPLVAAARHAEVDVLGGCLGARSYGVPDVSGGVAVTFEEVSGGVAVTFEEVYLI